MKIDIARQPLVPAFVTLFALAVTAMWGGAGNGVSAGAPETMPLLGGALARFQAAYPVCARLAAGFMILFTGMCTGRIAIRYNLYGVSTCLPIPLYAVVACGIVSGGNYLTAFAASMLLALAAKNYCRSYCNGYGFVGPWRVQNSGGGTTSPESPLQGLIKSHNTTQASMASNIGLCAIADAAKEMGYHNAISNASDIYSANSFQPPMTIGTVQASPLTMANVYATMGANGVECTPIAITKVTDRSGSKVKVPSANCHQAIDPDIAQTVSYALNQGVVQPGGEASTTQLDNNRKTFAKTGTNENTVMTTAGFVPNQVAAFVAVADAQDPINNTFDNKTINGVYRPSWYGMYIATPAWKQFMNTYLAAINAPIDNDYGKGADKYTVSKGATRTYIQYQYQRQQNSQQQSQQQTNQGQQQQSQQQPAEQQSDQQHQ